MRKIDTIQPEKPRGTLDDSLIDTIREESLPARNRSTKTSGVTIMTRSLENKNYIIIMYIMIKSVLRVFFRFGRSRSVVLARKGIQAMILIRIG